MSLLDTQAFAASARQDPEFIRETRYYDGLIKLGLAEETVVLSFKQGKLTEVAAREVPDADCKIVIKGSREHWTNMLARRPKPFYQCLQSTAVKHRLSISDSNETFAYLPALNRMLQLMRDLSNKA